MAAKKGLIEVVAWGNVSQQRKITQIVLTQLGLIREFLIGGPNFGSERTEANYFSPYPLKPATVVRYKSLAPYVYLNSFGS